MDRLQTELEFHDWQASCRAQDFRRQPDRFCFADDDYLQHETWIQPAFDKLGDVSGKRVLDFGCGHGMASVVLARHGARVTAFDLSLGYLSEACARAEANGVHIDFVQADGEHLPFADGSFDGIWGNAVLHHLDLHRTGAELQRVLRPRGLAVFCEPWGENPLLNWTRAYVPYPHKQRTPDEQPLRMKDIHILEQFFPHVYVEGFQLLSMFRRLWPNRILTRFLQRSDDVLLKRWTALHKYCRYVVVSLQRE